MRRLAAALALLAFASRGEAEPVANVHFQSTVIDQGHARFHAPYSGPLSLKPDPEKDVSITATLFAGWHPFGGTFLYLDPELSGGQGMSGAQGLAGFANGETYRIGNPAPVIKTARLYIQQIIGLGGETEGLEDGPDQVAAAVAATRLTLTAGKFALVDWFDDNSYSHDPRTQFLNASIANSAAWDYPADTYGYTWGGVVEYRTPSWAARAAAAAEPKVANEADLDRRLGQAHGLVVEADRRLDVGGREGLARLLLFANEARMGSYEDALAAGARTSEAPDVTLTRGYGRHKLGFTSSDELALSKDLGAFARLSWNDGKDETWAFEEADASAVLGAEWTPARWGRGRDRWGAAEEASALSNPHRRYLAAGGEGFMLGDGALHYGPELVTETYYRIQCNDWLQLSPDAQLIVNPGYNRARGPVPIWAVRAHVQF